MLGIFRVLFLKLLTKRSIYFRNVNAVGSSQYAVSSSQWAVCSGQSLFTFLMLMSSDNSRITGLRFPENKIQSYHNHWNTQQLTCV